MMDYWDRRYTTDKMGSGKGSEGDFREFIQEIFHRYIKEGDTVLDYGCGDLQLWDGFDVPIKYTGVDNSYVIINFNYRQHLPFKTFKMVRDLEKFDEFNVGVCISVLIHVMTRTDLKVLLDKLNKHVNKILIIQHWIGKPKGLDETYQRYWQKEDWAYALRNEGWKWETMICYDDNLNAVSVFRRK